MTSACALAINEALKSTKNIEKSLKNKICDCDLQIGKLKELVLLQSSVDPLTSFYNAASSFRTQAENLNLEAASLFVSAAEEGKYAAKFNDMIASNMRQIESLSNSLKAVEFEELLSQYRSDVDAARVLGSLDLALESFDRLAFHLGFHVDSQQSVFAHILPAFFRSMLVFFLNEFKRTLSLMELPKIRSDLRMPVDDCCPWGEQLLQNFCRLFSVLSRIHLPENGDQRGRFFQLSLPMRIIMDELEKRFLFNFYGDRVTNKLEKPEWYFAEVLSWVVLNDQWLTWIYDEHLHKDLPGKNLRVEFMRGLIGFVTDKISFDLGLISNPPKSYCSMSAIIESIENCSKNNKLPERNSELILNDHQLPCGLRSSQLVSDLGLFGHLIDEILDFEGRLDGLCYPFRQLRPVDILTRLDVLQYWLCLESKVSHARLQSLISKPDAWEPGTANEAIIPQCVEDFVALFYAISRRGAQLRDAKARAYFFRVQLNLLFTFFSELVSLLPWFAGSLPKSKSAKIDNLFTPSRCNSYPKIVPWMTILNALYYVCEAMQDWTNDQCFVEMWEYCDIRQLFLHPDPWIDEPIPSQMDLCEEDEATVLGWKSIIGRLNIALERLQSQHLDGNLAVCPGLFSQIFDLYQRRIRFDTQMVIDTMYKHFDEMSRNYQTDAYQWQQLSGQTGRGVVDSAISAGLSSKATDVFIQLSETLRDLNKFLHPQLFARVWKPLIKRIDTLLYTKVILGNRFSAAGAAQLQYDIADCLQAVISAYTEKPSEYLGECLDACKILCLPHGVAELLKQSLAESFDPKHKTAPTISTLTPILELGVCKLTPDEVYRVLKLRLN